MSLVDRSIADLSPAERKAVLRDFLEDVLFPQRARLIAYSRVTQQSAQVDSDGYLAQIIASIVLGVPGNRRKGKSGAHVGDLSNGTEVKSSLRLDQKNGMQDTHINFGAMQWERMAKFLTRPWLIVVTSLDSLGRFKVEVLSIDRDVARVHVEAFYGRSRARRPQFQPRLYTDGRHDRLHPSGFVSLGARLVARAVETGEGAVVDVWDPPADGLPLGRTDEGVDLEVALTLAKPRSTRTAHEERLSFTPEEFFKLCMADYRNTLLPYCQLTASTENVGYGNLAQHLVSLVTGIPGTSSNARGADLADGSEVKLATGVKGDCLGTEDFPRLNLHNDVSKMLAWPDLYAVRLMGQGGKLMVKVLRAPIAEFRQQTLAYFSETSRYARSPNLQYHAPRAFESNVFTGRSGNGNGGRRLEFEELFSLEEA